MLLTGVSLFEMSSSSPLKMQDGKTAHTLRLSLRPSEITLGLFTWSSLAAAVEVATRGASWDLESSHTGRSFQRTTRSLFGEHYTLRIMERLSE